MISMETYGNAGWHGQTCLSVSCSTRPLTYEDTLKTSLSVAPSVMPARLDTALSVRDVAFMRRPRHGG